MKGRGLLIAAAVIQLVGAAFFLLSGVMALFMMPMLVSSMPRASGAPMAVFTFVGVFYLAMAGLMTLTSVKLIQRRRWAWIVSLVMSSLCAAFILLGGIAAALGTSMRHRGGMGVGFGEVIILFFAGSPIFAVIGLLIGGRHAIGDAPAPRA